MDITMCNGEECPLKETCVRHKAERNPIHQSMFMEIPYKDGDCNMYWEIKEDTPLTEKEEMERFYKHINEILKTINGSNIKV